MTISPNIDISVVITSHRRKLLPYAMQSVFEQTYPAGKIQMLVQYSPQWWGEKMNDAVLATRGKYYLQLCDDDTLAPTFLEETIALAETSGADFVYTDQQSFDGRLWKARGWTKEGFYGSVSCPVPVTVLTKRSWYDKVGGYDPDLAFYDWDLFYRCFKLGARGAYIPKPLFHYRAQSNEGSEKMDFEAAKKAFFTKHEDLNYHLWKRKDELHLGPKSYPLEEVGAPPLTGTWLDPREDLTLEA